MNVMRHLHVPPVLLLLAALLAGTARAQAPDTLVGAFTGHLRSTWEEYYLSLFQLEYQVPGARASGMGGAGLALRGGVESYTLNPVGILGLTGVQVQAGVTSTIGGAGVGSFPDTLPAGPETFFQTSNYRVSPLGELDYAHISVGMPLTLLGQRGAGALSYRRVQRTGQGDEVRLELQGEFTAGAEATYGVGNETESGMDAISAVLARGITSWLDLGINANFMSGTLGHTQEVGVSTIGQVLFEGGTRAKQEVSAFSVDVGARVEAGPVTLAGTALLPHRLKFRKAAAALDPLPNPQTPNERIHIESRPVDYDLFIPARFGFGAAAEPMDRLTVAADLWVFPWATSRIHREGLVPVFGFDNPSDASTFRATLVRTGTGEEVFDAGLEDTHSLRVGAEYRLLEKPEFGLSLWAGFRTEKLSLTDYTPPSWFTDRDQDGFLSFTGDLVVPYREALDRGDAAAAGELGARIAEVVENNYLLFRGDPIQSTTITLGAGIEIQEFLADMSFEFQKYDLERYFLSAMDPLLSPGVATAKESRSITRISLSLGMRY
jgi:hypothetical protein